MLLHVPCLPQSGQDLLFPAGADLELADESADYAAFLLEEKEEMLSRPVMVNSAGEDEIARIPYLGEKQRKNLEEYLRTFGPILSAMELTAIPGFDSTLAKKVSPYVSFSLPLFNGPFNLGALIRNSRHDLIMQAGRCLPDPAGCSEIKDKAGNSARVYPGDPFRYGFRYTCSSGNRFSAGISGDKDAGEQFFSGAQKYGLDHYSGYLFLRPGRVLSKIILGNFRAGWGLGLTFSPGYSMGSYPGFLGEFTGSGGIRPTQSLSGSNNLRGAAFSLRAGHLRLEVICSYLKRDASVSKEDPVTGRALSFSSFLTTGYHRTGPEISKMARVGEFIAGGNLSFRGSFFSAGVTAYYSFTDAFYQPSNRLANRFAFSGKYNLVTGADLNIFYKNVRVCAELSRSMNGTMAFVGGLTLNPDPRLSFVAVYRNYPPSYQNLYAGCFRQNSLASNENGWFFTLAASLPQRISLYLFSDFCNHPWIRYGQKSPDASNELGIMFTWSCSSTLNLTVRYIFSQNGMLPEAGDSLQVMPGQTVSGLRLQLSWTVLPFMVLQSRIELKRSTVSGSVSGGSLAYQECCWKSGSGKTGLTVRYTVFDCPDYQARIWAWEPDLMFAYSIPSFYGKGTRVSLLYQVKAGRHLQFALHAACSRYSDRNTIGSGADMTRACWRLDLSAQVRVRI